MTSTLHKASRLPSFKSLVSGLWLLVSISAYSHAAEDTQPNKPNILIFLVDDMGLMDTSVPFVVNKDGQPVTQELNKLYQTPNMEKLAARGLRFSHFYANSVCSPTRVSLLNGQWSARHKTTQWISPTKKNEGPQNWNWAGLTPDDIALPKLFKEAGYTTIHTGKAHLGPHSKVGSDPTKINFDHNIGGTAMGQPGSYLAKDNFGKGKRQVPHLEDYHGSDTFLTEAISRETNKKLTEITQGDKPFFLHRSHYALHSPFQIDERFAQKYRDQGLDKQAVSFCTLVEGMDQSLGDLLAHLESLGEAEKTLVIFLGDNGSDAPLGDRKNPHDYHSSSPYRGKKATHYEGGMLAPLIIAWAKDAPNSPLQKQFPIKPGIVSHKFVTICDLFPTILQVAGLEEPKNHDHDGHTLTPFLANHDGHHSQEFLMHFPHRHRSTNFTAYRKDHWKLIKHYQPKDDTETYQLFHLHEDPYEKNNLAEKLPDQKDAIELSMQAALKKSSAQFTNNKLRAY